MLPQRHGQWPAYDPFLTANTCIHVCTLSVSDYRTYMHGSGGALCSPILKSKCTGSYLWPTWLHAGQSFLSRLVVKRRRRHVCQHIHIASCCWPDMIAWLQVLCVASTCAVLFGAKMMFVHSQHYMCTLWGQ